MVAELHGQCLQQRCIECGKLCLECRQQRAGIAQLGQVARPGRAQRDAREDPFEITDLLQGFAQRRRALLRRLSSAA
jgi:hypothetical protein